MFKKPQKYDYYIKDLEKFKENAIKSNDFKLAKSLNDEISFVKTNLKKEDLDLTDKQYKLVINSSIDERYGFYKNIKESDKFDVLRSYEDEGIFNFSDVFDYIEGDDKFERPSDFLKDPELGRIEEKCEADKKENEVSEFIFYVRAICSMMGFDPIKRYKDELFFKKEDKITELKLKYNKQLEKDRIERLRNNLK